MNWDWEKLKEQQQRKGGGGVPPQVDDLMQRVKQFKVPGGPLIAIVVIVLLALGSTSVYQIAVDEVGVIQRFGKYVRTTQPGLHFKLPKYIEEVTKVRIRHVYKEEFGFRSVGYESRSRRASESESNVSLMLTGDLNVAVVPWIVQYRIKDPYNYLFKVNHVRKLLMDMSEAAMRLVVGDSSINEVITKRQEIADKAREVLQRELDHAETGLNIVTIEMKKTNVPGPVQPSFNEVNQALQEKEQLIYQAREEYNKAIPAARGEAQRTIKAAEGYAEQRVNRALGDASRFSALYSEYVQAKDVTKRRMYLEAIRDVFPKVDQKYIVDEKQKNLLPLLNLGKTDGDK